MLSSCFKTMDFFLKNYGFTANKLLSLQNWILLKIDSFTLYNLDIYLLNCYKSKLSSLSNMVLQLCSCGTGFKWVCYTIL